MKTTTTPAIVSLPRDGSLARGRVPSLDEIYELTAVPDQRVLFPNVDWLFYEQLVDSIPESSNIHVDYEGRDLEIMAKGLNHEELKTLLGRVVDVVTEELEIPCKGLGETTWKRAELARGLEADNCYYLRADKLAAAAEAKSRGSKDIADYPNPDLAIEVDITEPRVNRPGIYAALRVAEVWRLDGRELVIERLTPENTYAASEASQFLPVRADEVRRWIVDEDSRDESAWARRLREEIRMKRETRT
jgi:Uma2 family endonuclease